MIVLDTCVLSEAFRKRSKPETPSIVRAFRQMIVEDWPMIIPGIVVQEFLTGFRLDSSFNRAEEALSGFKIHLATYEDHKSAAFIRTICQRRGIQCATIDALIAAITINLDGKLLTLDGDFQKIAKAVDLSLFDINDKN